MEDKIIELAAKLGDDGINAVYLYITLDFVGDIIGAGVFLYLIKSLLGMWKRMAEND